MRAIYLNGSRIIDKLLELGVDINTQVEANGNLTAIMLAIECNNLPTVRRLLESDTPVLLSAQVTISTICSVVITHKTEFSFRISIVEMFYITSLVPVDGDTGKITKS